MAWKRSGVQFPSAPRQNPRSEDLGFFRFPARTLVVSQVVSYGKLEVGRLVNADGIPDQSFEAPAAPQAGQPWPKATPTAYPMKPTDTLLHDGTIRSEALGRIKDNQHEQRVVVEWVEDRWVVVRRRLAPAGGEAGSTGTGASMGAIFDPTPEQWGLRGDPEMWAAMREMLEETELPKTIGDARALLWRSFRLVAGVDVTEPLDRVYAESIDRGGMSGGWLDLNLWQSTLMPLLEERLRGLLRQR
jgi:hypothetical protein